MPCSPSSSQDGKRGDGTRSSDPFQQLLGGFGEADLDRDDPLIERLFPDAYPDDPAATADFRRFTEADAVRARLADAHVVLDDLGRTEGGSRPLRVPNDHADAWVKTLNALRLALSVRLGIVDDRSHAAVEALPADDPRSHLADLYDWLGYVLESLLHALDG